MHFLGQVVTVFREEGREIDVSLMFPEESRQTIADLEDMKVTTSTGAQLPLIELATFTEKQGAVALIRQNQQAQMNVSSEIYGYYLNGVVGDNVNYFIDHNIINGYSFMIDCKV